MPNVCLLSILYYYSPNLKVEITDIQFAKTTPQIK